MEGLSQFIISLNLQKPCGLPSQDKLLLLQHCVKQRWKRAEDLLLCFFRLQGWGRLEYNLCSFTILHDIYDEVSLPSEIIENFTENIGRPPELPKWIISGAVVGMQGGTEAVRRVWDELKDHSVPISAFWLQVFPVPFIKYHRSEELLMRWMELNAFTTVFRTHEGNKPSCNSQFYSNHKTLSHFARCAKLYKAWYFYRTQLVKEAAQKGLPVCRHLFIHYPNDRNVHSLSYQQFLIGTEILVVPVLDKGKKNVKAYFPEGETCSWQHIWSGKLFKEHGSEAWVEAPVGYPPVFIKAGSTVGETFVDNLRNFGIL